MTKSFLWIKPWSNRCPSSDCVIIPTTKRTGPMVESSTTVWATSRLTIYNKLIKLPYHNWLSVSNWNDTYYLFSFNHIFLVWLWSYWVVCQCFSMPNQSLPVFQWVSVFHIFFFNLESSWSLTLTQKFKFIEAEF